VYAALGPGFVAGTQRRPNLENFSSFKRFHTKNARNFRFGGKLLKKVVSFDGKSNKCFPKTAQKCKNLYILSEKLDIFSPGPRLGQQPRLSMPLL